MNIRRRDVLLACRGFPVIVGCSASVGTYDLVVMNCTEEEASAEVQMRRDGDSEAVLDETYAVPAKSCGDLTDGVQVEDVFPEGGTYDIHVEPEGRTPVTESISVH